MPDDFEFQSPDEVNLDDFLTLGDGGEVSPDFMTSLAVPEEAVVVSVPVKDRDASELASDVESLFISLLEDGRRDTVLQLVGEVVRGGATSEVFGGDLDTSNFRVAYAKGSEYNPALKWYPKFISALGDGISVLNGQLSLRISATVFRRMVQPFLSDFNESLVNESPLVELVFAVGRKLNAIQVDRGLSQYAPKEVVRDRGDLNASELNFQELQIQDGVESLGGEDPLSFLEDSGDARELESPADATVSMVDLSNKAISDYFVEKKIPLERIEQILLQDGFPKSRVNEIVCIVRYVRFNSDFSSLVTAKGSRNAGVADFKF